MLLLASFLLVVSTSCEKEEDDNTPPVENGNNSEEFVCGNEFTDPRDGTIYSTVQIGDQCWMAKNLAYLPEITYEDDWSSLTEPQYAVYGYAPGSGTETVAGAKASEHYGNYGVLYNWAAAMDGAESSEENPSGVQGICPPGWHLPSDYEWTELVDYVVAQGYPNEYGDPNGAGNALKSCRQVDSPLGGNCDTSEHPRWEDDWSGNNHFGTDEFGFSALPGGLRYFYGSFYEIGRYGTWWSASDRGIDYAWSRGIGCLFGDVLRLSNGGKNEGFSVRCLRYN